MTLQLQLSSKKWRIKISGGNYV